MDSYGDGNVYRGQVCKDSEIKTIEINEYDSDVERLVEAARHALYSMENLCDYRQDHGMEIDKLKTALEPFNE